MRPILTFILMLLLIFPSSAATLTDAFNGSVSTTDSTIAYGESISLPEGAPDYIRITISGDYPEYAEGYPYLNNLAYYELDTDAEDTTGSHDGTFNGASAGTFDGIDDYVSIPASSDFNTTDFTVSALINADDFEQKMTIWDAESYAIRITQAGTPYVEVMDDDAYTANSIGTVRSTSYYTNVMCEYNGQLYAGIYSGYVYRYDGGTTWTSCGQVGSSTTVTALAVHNGKLYAGCGSGSELANVYRYDGGTTWTWVAISSNGNYINSMCSYDGKLYAGDDLGTVIEIIGVDNYDTVGTPGTTTNVRAMVVYRDQLYVSGSGDGIVYRYDGSSTWTSIGDIGAVYHITGMAVYDGTIYASCSGSTYAGYVFKWDGVGTTTWSSCGRLGTSTENRQLCVYNGKLYGSTYTTSSFYRYDGGTTWTAISTGGTRTYCLTTYDGKLIIGTYRGYAYAMGTGEAIYGSTLSTGTNYILTAVKESGTVTFYINDVSQGTATASFGVDTAEDIFIGKARGTTSPAGSEECFDGSIHNVGYWDDGTSVYAIYNDATGLLIKSSADSVYIPYEEGLISWGTLINGFTFKNTDGNSIGVTVDEYYLADVTTSNEINTGGVYSVDLSVTVPEDVDDGIITIPVEGRVFNSASVDSGSITYETGYLYIDTGALSAGLTTFSIDATYETGVNGYTYTPSNSNVELIALENSQEFSVSTSDEATHSFLWELNGDTVQSEVGTSSSYTYPASPYGSDVLTVTVDSSVHTWYINNGLNTTKSTKSMTNMKNLTLAYKTIDDYPGFSKLAAVDENNTTALIEAFLMPVNSYWTTDNALGAWFYALLVILTVGVTYIKTKTLETTSLVLLILSLMVAVPATAGTFIVPTAMLYLMYMCVVLGVAGIFGGLFME